MADRKRAERMIRMRKSDNTIVKELLVVILCYGLLLEAVFVFLTERRLYMTSGLWIGIALAVFMLINMYRALDTGLDLDAKTAKKYVMRHSILRYVVVLAAYGILIFARLGSPLTCFAGIFGLKVAAYVLPAYRRFQDRRKEKKEVEEWENCGKR